VGSRVLSALQRLEVRPAQRYRRDLWLIVTGGVLFKLFFLWLYIGPPRLSDQLPKFGVFGGIGGDSYSYYAPALTLRQSGSYFSESRTPGYPAFLALIYAVTGDPDPISNLNLTTIYVVQSVMITLGCVPLAGAIRRLTGFRSLALAGAVIWAFHNSARYYSHWLLTDALAATLTCCLAYAIVRALADGENVPLLWFGITGAVMLALTLVRPSCSLLAVPVGMGLLFTQFVLYGNRRQWLAMTGLLLVLPLSSQNLWAWRNYALEGKWYFCRLSTFGVYAYGFAIPIAMSKGESYYVGNDIYIGVWREYNNMLDWMSPQGMDDLYRLRMKYAFREHPGVVISHYLSGIPALFIPTLPIGPMGYTPAPSEWRRLPWGHLGIDAFILFNSAVEFATTCGLLGLLATGIFSRRRWPDPARRGFFLTAVLAFSYWVAIHAISARFTGFFGASRFFLPFVPLLVVAAAAAAAHIPPIASIRRNLEPADPIESTLVELPPPVTGA